MTSAGPTPENEGVDPELQAAVESAFEEVPDDVREGLAQGSPEGAAGQADAASDEAAGEDPLAQAQAQAAQAADDLARARADLYNLQQEYQGFVRRSREGAASHRDAGAAGVVEALIPVLDEIELARQHGDLTGTFATTAGKLETILADKFGLVRFGEVGEPFDAWTLRAPGRRILGVDFVCRWRSGDVRLSHEHESFAWLTLEEVEAKGWEAEPVYRKAFELVEA